MTTAPQPEPRVRWRYHMLDFLTGNPLAVLPMRSVKLDEVLSGASTGAGEVPLTSPVVQAQDPRAATQPRRSLCFAERLLLDPSTGAVADSSVPWAGLVMGRKQTLGGRGLTLSLVTLPSYWKRRTVKDHSWTDTDPMAVQRALFAEASACGWDGSTPPVFEELTAATPNTAGQVLTTREYLADDGTPALEAGSKVATECGFDWRVIPYYDATAGRFRVRLDQGYPRVGRVAPPDLRWSADHNRSRYGFAAAGDIIEDGSNADNRVTALGEGTGPAQLRSTASSQAEMDGGYPIYESMLSSSGLDLRTTAAVQQHATGSLVAGLAGEVRVTGIQVRGDLDPDLASYTVGDDVQVTIRDRLTGQPLTVLGQLIGRSISPAEQDSTELVTLDVQGTAA